MKKGLVHIPKMDREGVLIYDIESWTVEGKPNAKKDIFRIFGAYSYDDDQTYVIPYTEKDRIQKLLDRHKYLVGFNNLGFDNPIMKRFGFNLEYKRFIDLMKIFQDRYKGMKTKQGFLGEILMDFKLDTITRILELVDNETAKDEIDYDIFCKDSWTKEEIKKIVFYVIRDIEITRKLYEWVENYFESLKDFLPEKEVKGKYHLSDTTAKFAYKVICNALGWEPVYDNSAFTKFHEKIEGGYVAYPADEKFEGNLYCLDFNSLYPHIMMQCNLYDRLKNNEQGYNGNGIWLMDGVYNNKTMHPVGFLLRCFYFLRLFYKRKIVLEDNTIIKMNDKKTGITIENFIGQKYYKPIRESNGKIKLKLTLITDEVAKELLELSKNIDPKEYAIKIIINICYGLLDNPYYVLVYDLIAASDCTKIGRQWTKYARKIFREAGYKVMYTDTDSWYVLDHLKDEKKLLEVNKKVIDFIKSTVPFPQPTFDASIDDRIKYMFFFKGKNKEDKDSDKEMDEDDLINKPKGFMKKNYIYVTTDDKVKIKNLGIKKKSISPLSKKIFWEHMVPYIKKGEVKFSKVWIENLMKRLLREDITLSYMRKSVKTFKAYEESSPNGMQAQIAKRYGGGIHYLIPNIRLIGVGKGVKYCSIEEFEQYKMTMADIDFNIFWSELNYFVKHIKKQKTLFEAFQ